MTEEDIQLAYDVSASRIREVETTFHRYLYSQIDWNVRILALDGPRGVGKTTMRSSISGRPTKSSATMRT